MWFLESFEKSLPKSSNSSNLLRMYFLYSFHSVLGEGMTKIAPCEDSTFFSGMDWQFNTFIVFITAFFCGQLIGKFIHKRLKNILKIPVTSCLIWDIIKKY